MQGLGKIRPCLHGHSHNRPADGTVPPVMAQRVQICLIDSPSLEEPSPFIVREEVDDRVPLLLNPEPVSEPNSPRQAIWRRLAGVHNDAV